MDSVALFKAILMGTVAFTMFATLLSYMFWQEDLLEDLRKQNDK